MKKTAMLIVLATLFALTFNSCTQVLPTEAGFKIEKSGNYRGVDSLPLLTGYQWYMPGYSEIITIPTTQNHTVWTNDSAEGSTNNQEITVSCMGGAGFKMDVGLNWRVDPNKASKIYLKYSTSNLESISNTYLRNVIRGTMQDESSRMTVDSLLNNLGGFENTVRENLRAKLAPEGFTVDLFNVLKQPTPTDPALAASIAAKVAAKQNAERTVTELGSSIAEANKKIATARGDSASQVIEATGKAEAIKAMQQQLTPTYVEYLKATRWDGVMPTIMTGNGGTMLQLPVKQ